MTIKNKVRKAFNQWLADFVYKYEDYFPRKASSWTTRIKRGARTVSGSLAEIESFKQEINQNHKHIRWACAVCGCFIAEVKEWPEHKNDIMKDCKNSHYNVIEIDRKYGTISFRSSVARGRLDTILRQPKTTEK